MCAELVPYRGEQRSVSGAFSIPTLNCEDGQCHPSAAGSAYRQLIYIRVRYSNSFIRYLMLR